MVSDRTKVARTALEDAVIELGRSLCADDGENEAAILTQFVVLSSWMMEEDDEGNARHRYMRMLSDESAPMHHLAGILQMALVTVQEEWK